MEEQGEAASANTRATASESEDVANTWRWLQQTTDFKCSQKCLILEEDAIYDFIAREEKPMPGFHTSKDCQTLVRG